MTQKRLNLLKSDIEARNAARQAKHQAERELDSKEQDLWEHLRRRDVPSYICAGEQADYAVLKERWLRAALQVFRTFRAMPKRGHLARLRSATAKTMHIPAAKFDPSLNEKVPNVEDAWRYQVSAKVTEMWEDRRAAEARNQSRRQVWEEAHARKLRHEQTGM